MLARCDDFDRAPDDRLPTRRMELIQSFGENRNVRSADLEQAVTAKRATRALELLGLGPRDLMKVRIRLLKNVPVTHRSCTTYEMTTFVSVW